MIDLKSIKFKFGIPWVPMATVLNFVIYSEVYEKFVVPKFNFGGMTFNPREYVLFELILLLFTSLLLKNKLTKPSEFYNWLYFSILLIPSAVLSAQQGNSRFHLFLMFAALWILIIFRWLFSQLIYNRTISNDCNFKYLPYYSVIVFVLLILVSLVISVKGVFNLNFENVYHFRFNISRNMPIALKYLLPLASGTLIGYLAALSLHRKDFKIMFVVTMIGVSFFAFSSHKSMLFNPFVAFAGYMILDKSRPQLLILGGLVAVAILILVLPDIANTWLGPLFVNRIFFVPSNINFNYFDFFSNNPFIFWAESKISLGLIDRILPMPVMKFIGGLMTGNYEVAANTGWVANAYMNAGVIGITIYAVIIGFLFSLIDFWANVYGKQLVCGAFLVPIITFMMSADLLIVFLTSGLIFLLIIFEVTTQIIFTFKFGRVNFVKN